MRYNKKIMTLMLIFLLIYVFTSEFITFKTGYENSSLTIAVFGFCSIEGGLLAWLKATERKDKK